MHTGADPANPDLKVETVHADELSTSDRTQLLSLFDETYAEANHDYLLASLELLEWTGIARNKEKLVGFAFGKAVKTDLPRFDEPQTVGLAGIACVSSDFRRGGLFSQLAVSAMSANGVLDSGKRFLLCGRMAHPASYRAVGRTSHNTVPTAGQKITPWHREMLLRIAELYKVKVDLDTGRVFGKGRPIGYPRMDIDATKDELETFSPVDGTKATASSPCHGCRTCRKGGWSEGLGVASMRLQPVSGSCSQSPARRVNSTS